MAAVATGRMAPKRMRRKRATRAWMLERRKLIDVQRTRRTEVERNVAGDVWSGRLKKMARNWRRGCRQWT
jgi:hypothetical protein